MTYSLQSDDRWSSIGESGWGCRIAKVMIVSHACLKVLGVMYILQETKIFTMLGEVEMANESTKTTQTSVWMAQHNERTRLHTYKPTRALVMPTLFAHCQTDCEL